jgi:hypothetical protein
VFYNFTMNKGSSGLDHGYVSGSYGTLTQQPGVFAEATDFIEVIASQGTHMQVRMGAAVDPTSIMYISSPDNPALLPLAMSVHGSIPELYESNTTRALDYVTWIESVGNGTDILWELDEYIPEAVPWTYDADFGGTDVNNTVYFEFVDTGWTRFGYFGTSGKGTDLLTSQNAIPIQRPAALGGFYGNPGYGIIQEDTWFDLVPDPDGTEGQVAYWEARQESHDTTHRQAYSMMNYTYADGEDVLPASKQVYLSRRMRLNDGYGDLVNHERPIDWLMQLEQWTTNRADDFGRGRFNFQIFKDQGIGEPLYFNTRSSYKDQDEVYQTQWAVRATIPVPIETWFTMKLFYRKGGASSGRFWVSIHPDGGTEEVICDVHGGTDSPWEEDRYDGLQFIKQYTIGGLVDDQAGYGLPIGQYHGANYMDNTTDPTGDTP